MLMVGQKRLCAKLGRRICCCVGMQSVDANNTGTGRPAQGVPVLHNSGNIFDGCLSHD